ncbi:hypothetical protein AAW14_37130 [Streptomyces hygroscopicus]|nr:hypothetical protein [Streptomyces hygroscopicus]
MITPFDSSWPSTDQELVSWSITELRTEPVRRNVRSSVATHGWADHARDVQSCQEMVAVFS